MSHIPIQHGIPARPKSHQSDADAWLASLPMLPCARSLTQVAPAIAHQIAAVWSDVSSTNLLLEQLLVGDGAPRLPSAVISDVLRLYEYNARCRVNDAPDTTWELPVSRHQCLTPNAPHQGNRS